VKLSGRQPHSSGPRHYDAPRQLCCLRSTGVQLGGGESRRKQRFARIATQVNSARSQPQAIEFHGGQGRNRTADASLFRATLYCAFNNLTDSQWPPKSLRSRKRQCESWIGNVGSKSTQKNGADKLDYNVARTLEFPRCEPDSISHCLLSLASSRSKRATPGAASSNCPALGGSHGNRVCLPSLAGPAPEDARSAG
jgi:hypothetical protein